MHLNRNYCSGRVEVKERKYLVPERTTADRESRKVQQIVGELACYHVDNFISTLSKMIIDSQTK